MSLPGRMLERVRGSLRYKLLVLVLFPILLVMPIALVLAIYWGNSLAYQQLFIKVNTDLSVSSDVFRRIRADYLDSLSKLAESYTFRVALESHSDLALQQQLDELKLAGGFSYLHLLDSRGRRMGAEAIAARSSAALLTVMRGRPNVGVEIFSQADLASISSALAEKARLALIATPRARPTGRTTEGRAMMIRALYPVKSASGEVEAVLDGGVMLNGNFEFVDAIRDLVYGPGSLIKGSIGTVTVFIDDVRITTNVPLRPGERALGTRVSDEVRSRVLDEGEIWIDRAFVVNDWYISAYEPILDVNNERVGMLYAGFLEKPFLNELWQALITLIVLFLCLMALAGTLAVRGAKSIFKPLEQMSSVVQATRSGIDKRIGQVDSEDEIGELAREFDAMLDLLRLRNQEIQEWADQLETKVEVRTAELRERNEDLSRTIRVLRETRQQLVIAEKLAALGELTAGVAHEINNPTAVMLGNMDIVVDELGDAVAPVQREIELIIEQIYRIKDIINNLLQYSRPEQYVGYLYPIDVNAVIKQTLALVQHLQTQEQFQITLDLRATCQVEINQQELQQVLVNLVVNAAHSLEHRKGQIAIRSADWEEQGVMIRVEDNGTGMDEAQLSRIFNPFYSTKEEGKGTGLGLSVSYGMIRRYGGNITAESVVGQGSVFSVWLLRVPKITNDEETISEQLHQVEH